jgi:exosortase C (VPDSG-CTERM-specific)
MSTSWIPGLFFAGLGVLILVFYQWLVVRGWKPERVDYLARSSASFLAFATAGAFFFLGASFMRFAAFPWAFLVFLVPFPRLIEDGLEIFFQYTSAEAAHLLIKLANLPVFREGLVFKLPGITIQVAQECSGIRSSLVLFITSLIAGQMFLRTPWKRAFLAFAVIPLAILRNGFRIMTISWLCVHIGPEMIDSPIHHRGGPIFFALSLIPFFALLLILRKTDRRASPASQVK